MSQEKKDTQLASQTIHKKVYKSPTIKTEKLEEASAQGQGGGGGKTCNGNANGGRKDTAGAGCTTLLT